MEFVELFTDISLISIILFVVGIALAVVEMFIPGFGIFGIMSAIVLIVDIFITADTITEGIILTVIFFTVLVIIFTLFFALASKGRLPRKLVLHESETGFCGTEDMQYLYGKTGVATATCRPVGNVDFDGVKLDVVSRGEYIEKGTVVEVIEVEGNRIVVKAKS